MEATIHPIAVRVLRDPLDEASGFRIRDPYVEIVYGPIVGPTALALARLLSRVADADPYRGTVEELAAAVGVRPSVASRSLNRLAMFGVARLEADELVLRAHVLPASEAALARLPELSVAYHRLAIRARVAA
jgi:hypothetical protein